MYTIILYFLGCLQNMCIIPTLLPAIYLFSRKQNKYWRKLFSISSSTYPMPNHKWCRLEYYLLLLSVSSNKFHLQNFTCKLMYCLLTNIYYFYKKLSHLQAYYYKDLLNTIRFALKGKTKRLEANRFNDDNLWFSILYLAANSSKLKEEVYTCKSWIDLMNTFSVHEVKSLRNKACFVICNFFNVRRKCRFIEEWFENLKLCTCFEK